MSQTAGRGIELGLDRMRSFMKELGDPQEKTAFIHVEEPMERDLCQL
ncbi:MAG: hypothetical protein ACLSCU_07500 [Eubacterium sp.]